MKKLGIVTLAVWIYGIPSVANAYLDPGMGAMLLQLLLGGVAGLLVILKLYWHRIKTSTARYLARKSSNSEGKGLRKSSDSKERQ